MCKQKQSTRFSQQQKSRAELKDYRTRSALLIAHHQLSSSDQGVRCCDHGTFSIGLHIGYKERLYLLTYSINCIFPTATNIHIYLFTVVVIRKTSLRQRTLIFTIVRPIKKLTLKRQFVEGNESSMELSFPAAKVLWNESSSILVNYWGCIDAMSARINTVVS